MGRRCQRCLVLLHNHHFHHIRRQSWKTSAVDGWCGSHGGCFLWSLGRRWYRRRSPWLYLARYRCRCIHLAVLYDLFQRVSVPRPALHLNFADSATGGYRFRGSMQQR